VTAYGYLRITAFLAAASKFNECTESDKIIIIIIIISSNTRSFYLVIILLNH
jgi:hypothetical protein